MLSIAVVDDEQVHRDILVKYIEEWKKQKMADAEVETFHSSDAFYFAWCGEQRFDVLFLDICMDGMDGVSLAKKLREKGKNVNIIFTTGVADYMQEGFEVEALHYLLSVGMSGKMCGKKSGGYQEHSASHRGGADQNRCGRDSVRGGCGTLL